MTFNSLVKHHLTNYKRRRLQISEDGIFKQKKQTRPHILPELLKGLNIIETYRGEFWRYWSNHREITLHEGFHHLNSSQAMCFNLFFPLIHERAYEVMSDIFQIGKNYGPPKFEKILDRKEQTNFDFYVKSESIELLFEIKYSENKFGDAKDDDRHRRKFERIYRENLNGKVRDEFLGDFKKFRKHYQIFRNIFHLNVGRRLILIFPEANKNIKEYVSYIKAEAVTANIKEKMEIIYLEQILQRILNLIPPEKFLLKTHYELFREKYVFV